MVWLAFDLGLQGDYAGLFAFLDRLEAQECGNGLAVFVYHYDADLAEELKRELLKAIALDEARDRLYLMQKFDDGRMHGTFLVGRRRRPPWIGYGVSTGVDVDETW